MTVNELVSDVKQILGYGTQLRLKYYTTTYASGNVYDDDVSYTQSGVDLWCSGLVQPVDKHPNGVDATLLEQGKIKVDDNKIYVLGSVATSGLAPVKIGIGSPIAGEYQILNQGQTIQWDAYGSPVYKKIYTRFLTNGSFVGE